MTPHWHTWPVMRDYVQSLAHGFVLEVGPGAEPFPRADAYVGWNYGQWVNKNKPFWAMDINSERLPYENKSVDFIYCRHTLEDIHNPFWVCQEMSRVAKAGYIETPSPIAEACRGVDGGEPGWRGYHHHRYLIWNHDGALTFLPKYPLIEYLTLSCEDGLKDYLSLGPLHWNTYYFWSDTIKVKSLCHERDFTLCEDYGKCIIEGVNATLASHKEVKRLLTTH